MKPFFLALVLISAVSSYSHAASQSANKKQTQKSAETTSTDRKQAKPVEEPETIKFALECTYTANTNHMKYFVQTSKSAYSTDGREGVSRPTLYATEDSRYVYTDAATMSGSTFDYEIQINRQNLNMTVFSNMRGADKNTYSATLRYSCVQADAEKVMALVNDLMTKEAAKDAAKKKELLDNQKL